MRVIKAVVRMAITGLLLSTLSTAKAQEAPSNEAEFTAAYGQFINCLENVVKIGMTARMEPVQFRAGFAKACKSEETAFKAEGVKLAMTQGRTEAEAGSELDANIAKGREVYAADQEKHFNTGIVP